MDHDPLKWSCLGYLFPHAYLIVIPRLIDSMSIRACQGLTCRCWWYEDAIPGIRTGPQSKAEGITCRIKRNDVNDVGSKTNQVIWGKIASKREQLN